MVDGFDYGGSKEISFCEPCTKGKHHKSPFRGTRAKEPLDLVHTDVCGKLNTKSLGGIFSCSSMIELDMSGFIS